MAQNHKTSDETVRRMRIMRSEGHNISRIAAEFGVARSTARKYLMDAHTLYPQQKLQNQDRRLPKRLRQQMRELRDEGLTNPQIAKRLGISRFTVVKYLGAGPKGKQTPELVAMIRTLQKQGFTQKEIAEQIGLSQKTITAWGLTNPNRPTSHRMTVKTLNDILAMHEAGMNGYEIAQETGFCHTTIYKYLREYA